MKVIKIIVKSLAWFLVGIIALLAIVLIVIQTPFAKRQIVRVAETQANKILNVELSVGKLSGNFFTNLALDEITLLSAEKDTLVSIACVQLNYRLLPLLKGKIVVENAAIENPRIHLVQLPDSSWNVMHLAKPSENEADTSSSSFDMLVSLERFALNNGFIKIDAFEEKIPDEIKDFHIGLSGMYSTKKQQVDLSDFRFKATNPDFELAGFHLQAEGNTAAIELKNLLLQTARNKMRAKGRYGFSETERSHIELETGPLILDEFKAFLPDNFRLLATPILNVDAGLENKNLKLNLLLKENEQSIGLNVLTYQLLEYFSDSTVAPVSFDAALQINKLDLQHWLNNPEMDYRVNGSLAVKGEGLDPETMRVNATGDFSDLLVLGNPVEQLTLQLNYVTGDVDGVVEGRGGFGSLQLSPRVQQILSNNPHYNINLVTRNLDASPVLGSEYKTDINLTANVSGNGLDLDKINARSQVLLQPSSAMGVQIDTLNSQIDFVRQNVVINRFLLEALSVKMQAEGNYHLKGNSELSLQAAMTDVGEISRFIGIDSLETSLNLNAHISGQPEDMNVDLQMGIGSTNFQGIKLDTINLIANGKLLEKEIFATADLNANGFAMSQFSLDNIHLHAETDTKNYKLGLRASGKEMQAQLNSMVQLGDVIRVALSELALGYKNYAFRQLSDTAHISISASDYEIRDFHLLSDSAGLRQSIYADGKISRSGSQDFELDISNLDIQQILTLLEIEQSLSGYAGLNVKLEGEAASPRLSAKLNVDSTALDGYRFDTVWTNIDLRDKELFVDMKLVPQGLGRMQGEGKLPVEARLDSMLFDFSPKETDSIYAKLFIDRLPLSILKTFMPAGEIAGEVNANLRVDGIMKQPNMAGYLKIDDGKAIIESYGIKYNRIQTGIRIEKDEVLVDTFLIQSEDGNMLARGGVKFNSDLYNADLNSSQLAITFNRFNPFDHKQFNMEMSGNVDLRADADSVRFSGDIKIPEAYLYLPAIMNLMGQFSAPNIPKSLLVKELERMEGDTIVYAFHPDTTVGDSLAKSKFEFLNNLQGEVKVEIPRNTWIRNDDMRIELSGNVELMKHRDFFELFGTIDVVRGQYNMLGKVFVIQSGTVAFHGGEKINPILNIDAVYSFRDSYRNKRDLGITVAGDLDNPAIKFRLDNADIGEGDALSYIIFGMSMDELTSGQQSALGSSLSASGIAETAAASLISSQVSKFLGNTGLVDYVDINVGSSFDSGSFTVGKYITNKLFVSYEQRIGAIEDKDVARYEMTLEYEIFKILFLQLTSSPITNGFDLIFKVNSPLNPPKGDF